MFSNRHSSLSSTVSSLFEGLGLGPRSPSRSSVDFGKASIPQGGVASKTMQPPRDSSILAKWGSKIRFVTVIAFSVTLAVNVFGDLSSGDIEKSFTNGSNPVWYDTNEKKLTFPKPESLQAAEDVLADRHQHIYVEPPVSRSTSNSWSWWDDFVQIISGLKSWILWGLLTLFVVGVVIYLWLAVEREWFVPSRRRLPQSDGITNRDRAKLVDLPFNIDIPSHGLLEQAEAYRRSGDYAKSIVYLFSHVLVELDDADCVRLQRGKTNRVYLHELKSESNLAELLQYLVQVFEAVFFGRYAVSREQCERCWSLLPVIHQSIQEAKQRRMNPVAGAVMLGLLVLAGTVGCGREFNRPLEHYGGSNSYSRKSVSGLTVFRELCEKQGFRTYEITSLSKRSHKLSAILWAPKDFRAPNEKEMNWFDEWLSGGSSRTLIFVGRDYSPVSHYWSQAAENAAPEDRRTFRLQQAYADIELEADRLRSESKLECDWFEQQLGRTVARRVEKFKGPWSRGLKANDTHIVLRGQLTPNSESRSSDWNDSVIEYGSPTIKTLLARDDGTPLVSSMSYKAWGESQLILVANGSVLMNESLTNHGNVQIVERLIDRCSPKGRIGFLSNANETLIRLPWDEEEPKGFEWLRVWPLSLIAIQGLFLGSIAMLAMLPIFGRPQRLPTPSTTDFGKHIEALGDLLAQSRDRNYALQRIADYFRDVRRDSASPWSIVASQPLKSQAHKITSTPFHSTTNNQTS